MELRESRAQAAIARKEKNAATTKATELKQALASVTKQNKVIMTSAADSWALTRVGNGNKKVNKTVLMHSLHWLCNCIKHQLQNYLRNI